MRLLEAWRPTLSTRLTTGWMFAISCALASVAGDWSDSIAQATKPPAKSIVVGFGWSVDLTEPARNGLDLVLLPGDAGVRTIMVTSIRFGAYTPEGLLGSTRAETDGFAPERRPSFGSLYMGVHTPVPLIPPELGFYGRVSGGLTMYLGQAFREAGPSEDPLAFQRYIGPRLAPGIELGIGARSVSLGPGFGLRSEFRLGLERVARAGFKMIKPTVVIGGDVPIRLR